MEDNVVYLKRDESNQTSNGQGNAINTLTPKLWILIEYRTLHPNTKIPIKHYEVVDLKDVCGASGRGGTRLEPMHTGKIIYVRKDTLLVQATIVTISDDKGFLDTELKDLVELQKNEDQPRKRRRTITPKPSTSPTPTSDRQITLYQQWNSHESTNGSPKQSSVIKSNPNVQNCPPMTFDQQTQTDSKQTNYEILSNDGRLQKILVNEESVLRNQHNLSLENQELKQRINDLSTQMTEFKSMLQEVLTKMEYNKSTTKRKPDNRDVENNSIIVDIAENNATVKTANIVHNPPRILNLSHSSGSNPQFYNSISIEPVDASNDSNFSFSNSRMSLSASNQSIYHNINDSNISGSTHNNSNSSNRDYNISRHSQSMEVLNDDDGNGEDEIVIGTNNTTVTRNILTNINWNSHTAATRRLLRAKFSREVLATHSLTGKPSPGELIIIFELITHSDFSKTI